MSLKLLFSQLQYLSKQHTCDIIGKLTKHTKISFLYFIYHSQIMIKNGIAGVDVDLFVVYEILFLKYLSSIATKLKTSCLYVWGIMEGDGSGQGKEFHLT